MASELNDRKYQNSNKIEETHSYIAINQPNERYYKKEDKQEYKESGASTKYENKYSSSYKSTNKILLSPIRLLTFVSTVIVVAVVYGVQLFTSPQTIIKNMFLRTEDSVLRVDIEFEEYHSDEDLKLEITNDFTNLSYDIRDNIIFGDEITYELYVYELNGNSTYNVKVIDTNYNVLSSKEVTMGSIEAKTKIMHVSYESYENTLSIFGELEAYKENEDVKIIISNEQKSYSYNMKDILEKESQDMLFFHLDVQDIPNGFYQLVIVTKFNVLYSEELNIEDHYQNDYLTSVRFIQSESNQNSLTFTIVFDMYYGSENPILNISSDSYSISFIIDEDIVASQDGIFYSNTIDDLEYGDYVFKISVNDMDIYSQTISHTEEEIENTEVSEMSFYSENLTLFIELYLHKYNPDQELTLTIYNDEDFTETYYLNESIFPEEDLYYYNQIDVESGGSYCASLYLDGKEICARYATVVEPVIETTNIDSIEIEKLNNSSLSYTINFEYLDENDSVILTIINEDIEYENTIYVTEEMSYGTSSSLTYSNVLEELSGGTYSFIVTLGEETLYETSFTLEQFEVLDMEVNKLSSTSLVYSIRFESFANDEPLILYISSENGYSNSINLADLMKDLEDKTSYSGEINELEEDTYTFSIETDDIILYETSFELLNVTSISSMVITQTSNTSLEYTIYFNEYNPSHTLVLEISDPTSSAPQTINLNTILDSLENQTVLTDYISDINFTTYTFTLKSNDEILEEKEFTADQMTIVDSLTASLDGEILYLELALSSYNSNDSLILKVTSNSVNESFTVISEDLSFIDDLYFYNSEINYTEGDEYYFEVICNDKVIYTENYS